MFDGLKSAVSNLLSEVSQKTLNDSDVDDILWKFEISLLENDVAQDVAQRLVSNVRESIIDTKINRSEDTNQLIYDKLMDLIIKIFSSSSKIDIIKSITDAKSTGEPYLILFIGVNGSGKTTSIAKLTKIIKDNGLSVVLASADTHRPGAIEQLTEHANRLSVKIVTQRYGADPAAVARDGVLYAKNHKVDVVLIDTAGRMQINKNLMEEMAKIIRVIKPNLKILVCDSLAGNDALSQAKEFMSYTDFNGAILTKADADAKGGAALSISYITGKPILFLGTGQDYNDLDLFDEKVFASTLFQ